MESLWECSGFERNEKGEVWLVWECANCGTEVLGALNPPTAPCPNCHKTVQEAP